MAKTTSTSVYTSGKNTGVKVVEAPNKGKKTKKPSAVRGKDLRSK